MSASTDLSSPPLRKHGSRSKRIDDTLSEPPGVDPHRTPLLSTVFRTSKCLRVLLSLRLAEFGIVAGQDQLLVAFQPDQRLKIGFLAAAIGVRPSTVSKMVDKMTEAGCIVREPDPGDARSMFIYLTPLGVHARGQVLQVWSELEADLRSQLPDADEVERQVADVEKRLASCLSRLR